MPSNSEWAKHMFEAHIYKQNNKQYPLTIWDNSNKTNYSQRFAHEAARTECVHLFRQDTRKNTRAMSIVCLGPSVCLSVWLSVWLASIWRSVCLSVCLAGRVARVAGWRLSLCVCLSVSVWVCLGLVCLCLSGSVSVCLGLFLSVWVYLSVFVCLCLSLSVCVWVCLSVSVCLCLCLSVSVCLSLSLCENNMRLF